MAFCKIMSAMVSHSNDKTIRRARQLVLPLFRRYARQFLPHRIGNAQPQRGDDGRHQGKTGERIESPGKAASVILRPAHHRRSEEAAEIADRSTRLRMPRRLPVGSPENIDFFGFVLPKLLALP